MVNTVNPKDGCHDVVIERCNSTHATSDSLSCQVQVLADMTCIEVKVPESTFPIPPCHPVGNCRPEKCNTAPHDKILVKTCMGNIDMQGWIIGNTLEAMGKCKEPV